jgi:hypothetical protein
MNDAQRYRLNAAECLSAPERCGPAYRNLTLVVASSWLSLARHQEGVDGLLAIWSDDRSAKSTASSLQQNTPELHRLRFLDSAPSYCVPGRRRCDRCERAPHRQAVGARTGEGVARSFWSMIRMDGPPSASNTRA